MRLRPHTLLALGLGALSLTGCGTATGPTTVLTRTVFATVTTPGSTTATVEATGYTTEPATTASVATTHAGAPTTSASVTTGSPPTTIAATAKAAAAVVRTRGYSVDALDSWDSADGFNVLLGTATGSGDGYNQQAFFFYRGRFVGTDTAQPSATVAFDHRLDADTVVLSYHRYTSADPQCCPSLSPVTVPFHWTGTSLVLYGTVPSYAERR